MSEIAPIFTSHPSEQGCHEKSDIMLYKEITGQFQKMNHHMSVC